MANRPRIPERLAAVACAAAVLVAACGGTPRLTRAQYEARLEAIGSRFSSALERAFAGTGSGTTSLENAAVAVRTAAGVLRNGARELEGLNPPPDAEAANAKLGAGLRRLAQDLDGFAAAAEAGNLAGVKAFDQQAGAGTLAGQRAILEAEHELEALGYRVG